MSAPIVRNYAAALVAGLLVVPAYFASRETALPPAEVAQLASRFKFTLTPLPEIPGLGHKMVRPVHPSLTRIAAWISSLGAAATLGDLDGDGLPNDVCFVDPRTDIATVAPVPGTPPRYQPFALDAAPLPYDAASTAPMGTVFGDFNEDGLTDVLVYYWGRTPVLFLQKSGASPALSRASFVAQELVEGATESWNTNAAIQADFDGDGHVDLLIGNYFPDGARDLDAHSTAVVTMHEGKAKAANGGRKHFMLWKSAAKGDAPSVHYEEAKGVLPDEVDRGWTLAAAALDLDGDHLPEVYLANDFGKDRLLHNLSTRGHLQFALLEGTRDFFTPKSCVLGHDTFKGMGVEFADVNGDGKFDIYVSNIGTKYGLTESHFLWLNTGDTNCMKVGGAPFTHGAEKLGLARSGWGWDCKIADFDNDGVPEAIQAVGFLKGTINRWPELQALGTSNDQIVHNPRFWPNFKPGADLSGGDTNPFFVMGKDGRYHDIAGALGLATPMVSRAIAIGDVDGDGRLDYALGNQWGQSYFVHNEAPNAGRFLGLHILLSDEVSAVTRPGHPTRAPNARPAIGAIVSVHSPDGRERVSFVDGGSGHSGRRSPEVHIGLGDIDPNAELPVKIRWRDGDGEVHDTLLPLKPGWHTVLLPSHATRIANHAQ